MTARLLIVEDSATQAEALRALLEEHGYEVVVARSAEAALEEVAASRFDAMLSDVVMPGLSGYELCRRLKKDPDAADLPVVLLTSLSDPMDIVQGLECGADNYITKPYDPAHLLARVRQVLENKRLRRNPKASVGVTVRFLGKDLSITSEKEQILDLFISTVEDVVRTNAALLQSQRALAEAHARLETFAAEKAHEARVSEARYRALLQNAGDAVVVLDIDGGIIEANPRAVDLLGRPIDGLSRHPFAELLASGDREAFRERFARLLVDRQMVMGEHEFLENEGRKVCCELIGSVTQVDSEELVLLIARDVTARKETEQALSATNERLQTLVAASPLAILLIDTEGKVRLWNPAAERLFGWTAEDAIGRTPPFVPPDRVEEYQEIFRRVLRGEAVTGLEVRRVRKDGSDVAVAVYAAPLRLPHGEGLGALALIADLTERNRAEEALRQRHDADRASAAKSEFLSRMSHELRTPLNAVLGFAQLLEADDLQPDQHESVEQILTAGRHLLSLIDEVLDLSRIEAGKMALSVEPVSVRGVVEEVCGMMRPLAVQQGLSIAVEHTPGGDPLVRADAQRLRQVLLNFVSNAVKYNRPGGAIRLATTHADDGWVRMAVADTGGGMSPQELEQLFVPFERLSAGASAIPGTGLGLSVTRGLVEAMGGRIGVDSRVGEGSTFWIELQVAERAEVAVGGLDEEDGRADGSCAEPGIRCTVLYIEDNPPNLRLVERILATRPGIRLLTAMEGRRGLELAREHHPELILLDLNLPDLSADEILSSLRADPELRDKPVVVISADAIPAQVKRYREAGAREYLTKPIDVKRFLQVVDDSLAETRA